MTEYQISLEALLPFFEEGLAVREPALLTVFEGPLEGWIHYVHRLLVLLEGTNRFQFQKDGRQCELELKAPALLFCAKDGKLIQNSNFRPTRTLSFSFYPTYIRAMHIDYDGVHPPPTSRDIYYHTGRPLSEAGFALLKAIDSVHAGGFDNVAGELLFPLLEITVADLRASAGTSTGQQVQMRKHWDQINTFLRDHREESISRSQLAKLFRISPGYVSDLCKQYAGESFSMVKLHYQLEHAENLLHRSSLNIDEIAMHCGFSSANYFIRRFRKIYGLTPHVFRNRLAKTATADGKTREGG